jgi:hypothetical protein
LELVSRGALTPALHKLQVGDELTVRKTAKGRLILGVASDEDSGAAAATKKPVALSTDSDIQLEMFTDAGHAASIFAKQPDLEPDIVKLSRAVLTHPSRERPSL